MFFLNTLDFYNFNFFLKNFTFFIFNETFDNSLLKSTLNFLSNYSYNFLKEILFNFNKNLNSILICEVNLGIELLPCWAKPHSLQPLIEDWVKMWVDFSQGTKDYLKNFFTDIHEGLNEKQDKPSPEIEKKPIQLYGNPSGGYINGYGSFWWLWNQSGLPPMDFSQSDANLVENSKGGLPYSIMNLELSLIILPGMKSNQSTSEIDYNISDENFTNNSNVEIQNNIQIERLNNSKNNNNITIENINDFDSIEIYNFFPKLNLETLNNFYSNLYIYFNSFNIIINKFKNIYNFKFIYNYIKKISYINSFLKYNLSEKIIIYLILEKIKVFFFNLKNFNKIIFFQKIKIKIQKYKYISFWNFHYYYRKILNSLFKIKIFFFKEKFDFLHIKQIFYYNLLKKIFKQDHILIRFFKKLLIILFKNIFEEFKKLPLLTQNFIKNKIYIFLKKSINFILKSINLTYIFYKKKRRLIKKFLFRKFFFYYWFFWTRLHKLKIFILKILFKYKFIIINFFLKIFIKYYLIFFLIFLFKSIINIFSIIYFDYILNLYKYIIEKIYFFLLKINFFKNKDFFFSYLKKKIKYIIWGINYKKLFKKKTKKKKHPILNKTVYYLKLLIVNFAKFLLILLNISKKFILSSVYFREQVFKQIKLIFKFFLGNFIYDIMFVRNNRYESYIILTFLWLLKNWLKLLILIIIIFFKTFKIKLNFYYIKFFSFINIKILNIFEYFYKEEIYILNISKLNLQLFLNNLNFFQKIYFWYKLGAILLFIKIISKHVKKNFGKDYLTTFLFGKNKTLILWKRWLLFFNSFILYLIINKIIFPRFLINYNSKLYLLIIKNFFVNRQFFINNYDKDFNKLTKHIIGNNWWLTEIFYIVNLYFYFWDLIYNKKIKINEKIDNLKEFIILKDFFFYKIFLKNFFYKFLRSITSLNKNLALLKFESFFKKYFKFFILNKNLKINKKLFIIFFNTKILNLNNLVEREKYIKWLFRSFYKKKYSYSENNNLTIFYEYSLINEKSISNFTIKYYYEEMIYDLHNYNDSINYDELNLTSICTKNENFKSFIDYEVSEGYYDSITYNNLYDYYSTNFDFINEFDKSINFNYFLNIIENDIIYYNQINSRDAADTFCWL